MGFDAKACLEKAKKGEVLDDRSLRQLCQMVRDLMLEENNVVHVQSPVTVVGDIHGQFHDVLEMLRVSGDVPDTRYVFLGDYVDRGYNSLETLMLVFAMKACYPSEVTLLRGNHECRQISSVYGFYDECIKKYGTEKTWRLCCEVFDYMPLCAVVDNETMGVHGGLSPSIGILDQIQTIQRCEELPNQGKFADLMWSDPSESVGTWVLNERGAGWQFGHKPATKFLHSNGLKLIARSHQLAEEGYQYFFQNKNVVTVWSAPNYCYRCGNKATVMKLAQGKDPEFVAFEEVSSNHGITSNSKQQEALYFL